MMAEPVVGAEGRRRNTNKKKKTMKMGGEGLLPRVAPKADLRITSLKGDLLFTVSNFFTSSESRAFIDAAESLGFAHQGSLGPTKGEAFRDNDRISINDPALADGIWKSGLRKIFSDVKISGRVAVGLNPDIRFYRYSAGQRFGRHIDESIDLGDGLITQYTLLVYLSGGLPNSKPKNGSRGETDTTMSVLSGGETVFYDHRGRVVAEVAPTEGMALLHLHGDKCMLHEARAVKNGIKYVFRSDVVFASVS